MSNPVLHRPAEWELHDAVWTAWPIDEAEWPGMLQRAQGEVAALCRSLVTAGEHVRVLVPPGATPETLPSLSMSGVELVPMEYADIWLRDTGPHYVWVQNELEAISFQVNGWGGKFDFAADRDVSSRIARATLTRERHARWVLEGGAVEFDAIGTCLTSEQCMLSPHRNPGMSKGEIEAALARDLGARKVLWVERGLTGDHTDGHIDTLARFVSPGVVVCAEPEKDDPNRDVLLDIMRSLRAMSDADGNDLQVITVPSPGAIDAADGTPLPGSYLNFVIGNRGVVVPQYEVPADQAALRALDGVVLGRPAIGSPARAILSGGGALHCITREQPRKPQ